MSEINETVFRTLLGPKLGNHLDRALAVFINYGPNLSFDVSNVLLYAIDKEKVPEVLDILEEHYKSRLQYQHPEIRGTVIDRFFGINPTEVMFLRICRQVLKLQPNPEQKQCLSPPSKPK